MAILENEIALRVHTAWQMYEVQLYYIRQIVSKDTIIENKLYFSEYENDPRLRG